MKVSPESVAALPPIPPVSSHATRRAGRPATWLAWLESVAATPATLMTTTGSERGTFHHVTVKSTRHQLLGFTGNQRMNSQRKRGPGRPFQPGVSGNVKGRPPSPNALAEIGREKVPAIEVIERVLRVLRSDNDRDALAAAAWLSSSLWSKPPTDSNVNLSQASASGEDINGMNVEQLRAVTAGFERVIAEQRALGEQPNAVESQPIETITDEVKP